MAKKHKVVKAAKKTAAKTSAPRKPKPAVSAARATEPAVRPPPTAATAEQAPIAQISPEARERIRGVIRPLLRSPPFGLVTAGTWDVAQACEADPSLVYEPDLEDVPDGRYRMTGHDLIVHIAGGKVVVVDRARPDVDPGSYQEVAATEN